MAILLAVAFIGVVGLIGIPIRMWQIFIGTFRLIYEFLNRLQKLLVVFGVVFLVPGVLLWLCSIYVIVMVLTDDSANRIWGVSELGITLSALGLVYLLVELMVLPVTWRQFKRP